MSAIHKRLHCAQRAEFNLMAIIFRDYLPQEYPYAVVGGNRVIKAKDFDRIIKWGKKTHGEDTHDIDSTFRRYSRKRQNRVHSSH